MQEFQRYAIYYAPPEGPFATAGAAWLGWDTMAGCSITQPHFANLDLGAITKTPRKYGFHGTIKPPFALAQGHTFTDLSAAIDQLCKTLAPAQCDGLALHKIGRFLALVPTGDLTPLGMLAAQVVQNLDHFRAAPTPDELARRRQKRLSPRQEENLQNWGYPYVMDDFKFHITLSGGMNNATAQLAQNAAAQFILRHAPQPFTLKELCLFGEAQDGQFHLLSRHQLCGVTSQ